jgi:hypothetical protein
MAADDRGSPDSKVMAKSVVANDTYSRTIGYFFRSSTRKTNKPVHINRNVLGSGVTIRESPTGVAMMVCPGPSENVYSAGPTGAKSVAGGSTTGTGKPRASQKAAGSPQTAGFQQPVKTVTVSVVVYDLYGICPQNEWGKEHCKKCQNDEFHSLLFLCVVTMCSPVSQPATTA